MMDDPEGSTCRIKRRMRLLLFSSSIIDGMAFLKRKQSELVVDLFVPSLGLRPQKMLQIRRRDEYRRAMLPLCVDVVLIGSIDGSV